MNKLSSSTYDPLINVNQLICEEIKTHKLHEKWNSVFLKFKKRKELNKLVHKDPNTGWRWTIKLEQPKIMLNYNKKSSDTLVYFYFTELSNKRVLPYMSWFFFRIDV